MHIYKQIILILVIITISIELTNARTRNSGGSKPSKPPGSTIKKLKKAALIGSGVYSAYKLAKAQSKFAKFDDPDIDFNTWNTWREVDGFLCKTDNHCNWLDENFECQQVGEFGWTVSADVSFIESIFESFYSVKYCNVNYSVK